MATYYADPAASGGGVGSVGDPFTFEEIIATLTGTDIGYVKAGTYTIGAVPTGVNSGTYGTGVLVEVYTSSGGDRTGTAVIDGTSTYASCLDMQSNNCLCWSFFGIEFKNATIDGAIVDDYTTITQCRATANGRYGFSAEDFCEFISCRADNNTTNGFYMGNECGAMYCISHDNGGDGITGNQRMSVNLNICDTNSSHGLRFRDYFRPDSTCEHNTVYNCDIGIYVDDEWWNAVMRYNIIDSCTTGIQSDLHTPLNDACDWNNFHNNTTDRSGVNAGTNDTTHDPEFVNAAGGDLMPENDSILKYRTFDFYGAATTTYVTCGAVHADATSGEGRRSRIRLHGG